MAFNWGSVDWGSVAGAAASIYSSNKAAGTAKDAGRTAAAGSDAATALQGQIYQDQRALNMPFYNSQLSALNQYNALLGLPSTQGGSGGGALSPQGFNAGQIGGSPMQWFGSASGTPTVNQQLYASDPAYKTAWDRALANNQRNFRSGFTNKSDRNILQGDLEAYYNQARGPVQQGASAGAAQQPAMTQAQAFDLFRNQPGYQFGLDQGTKTVQAGAAARGGLYSGAAMKALQRFGNDYADQQGFTPYMNRIASAAGIGQVNPVSNMQNAGSNYASNAGGFMQNAANARASGMTNAASARYQGYSDAAGFLGNVYGNYGGGR